MPQPQQDTEVADRSERARQVIDEYLRRRAAGETADSDKTVSAHPDLTPELENEFRKLQLIERARVRADRADEGERGRTPSGPSPSSFPGYDVIRRISRGGQGVVYQAIDKRSKREVAIKVMRDGDLAGPRDHARFQREVRILNALNHPRIVTIRDSGMRGEHAYFIMDYIPGRPLDVYMTAKERSVEETLRLFQEICRGVNAAHLRGVIHRDLKPSNIRVDDDGNPHILDFGLAKMDSGSMGDDTSRPMTVTGQFVGSLPWAAPEQVDGSPDRIDVRTDVYALGVVLFQALTGHFPYNVVGNMRDVMDNIAHAEPNRPSALRSRVNDELDTIVLKCLSKEPERRYQSAGDLARDIERLLRGQPIEAKRDSTWYVLHKSASRHRIPITIGVAIVLLITGFSIAMAVLYRRASNEAATAHRVQALLESMFTELEPVENASKLTIRDILDQSADRVASELVDEPKAQAALMETLANRYRSIGLHESAAAWMERALRIRRSVLRDEDNIIADRLAKLGAAYWSSGAEDKAEAALDESLMLYRRLRTRGNPGLVAPLVELARLRHLGGAQEEAARIFREALDLCRTLHAEPHQDTIDVLIGFGGLLGNMGNHQEARQLKEEALAIARRLYDADHLQLAEALGSLGGELQDMGQFQAALLRIDECFTMTKRLFPGNSGRVTGSMVLLGLLRKDMGDYDAAESLICQALDMDLQMTGGHGNRQIANKYLALAKVYSDAGDWTRAEESCRKSLDLYRRLLRSDHMVVARPLSLLGRILVHLKRFEEAKPLLRQALTIRQTRRNFPGDWKTAKTESVLGACLTGQGKYDEAEQHLLHGYPIIAKDRGPGHRRTIEAIQRVINLYEAWNKPDKAAKYRAILSDATSRDSED